MSVKTNSILTKSANVPAPQTVGLPLRRELDGDYARSLVIAVLMALASAAGLLYQAALYPTEELILSFVPNDLFNLAVGLPLLLDLL